MLRGAAQGAPMQQRLEGLLPTMALPERALSNLARQPTPRLVVAHLVTLAFPGATGLIPLVSRAEPNLFELDLALVRAFAARGAKAAGGDRNLRAFVARRLDLCNVELALALARGSHELDASRCFVDGGALLGLAAFRDLCGAGGDAPRRLERVLRGTPLSAVVREADTPSRLERAFLKNELAIQRREMRTDPLTSAPLLSFLLRIEAQSTDLRRVSWGAALRTPGSALLPELVTPWT